jgi:hypothetical protein
MKVVHRSIAYVANMINMLIAKFVKGFHVTVHNMIMEKVMSTTFSSISCHCICMIQKG